MDVGSVAEELYGLAASEFTVARDRQAVAARQAGDRTLAAEIKKLRRPTASASLANTLVRQRPDQVDGLLSVGAAMRDAQARLEGDELRRLSQEGQRLIGALSNEARRVAGETGQQVSDATGRELDGTLHAALADAGAGEALRSGCLTTPLQYSGFGMVDVAGAVAVPTKAARAKPAPPKPAPARPAKAAAAAAPAAPEPDLSEVRAELVAAKKEANLLARRAEIARRRRDDLGDQVRQLREQLEQTEARAVTTAAEADELGRARHAAQLAVAAVEERLRQARTVKR